ncbi:MAG: CopG family transcriptional regulator [bacterium]|nr:CopG family transcriptional regulator [bacterium]MBU1916635.1 CopG family transcriptional regulator [bacterium]
MKKKTKYTKGPIKEIKVLKRDFLPSPDQLAFKEDQVKVTMFLSKNSVEFFKKQAKKHDTQYQKMIRNLLDFYVMNQK